MQKKIVNSLTRVSIICFAATILLLFLFQGFIANANAEAMLDAQLENVIGRLQQNELQINEIKKSLSQDYLARAKAFAIMIQNEPEILHNRERLREIQTLLDVEGLHVVDGNGYLIAGTNEEILGMDFYAHPQTIPFLAILQNPAVEIVQEPQINTNNSYLQYIGVARRDEAGIVQISVDPERFNTVLANNGLNNTLSDFNIGIGGYVFSLSYLNQNILWHPNPVLVDSLFTDTIQESGFLNIDNERMMYKARAFQDQYIIAVIPTRELITDRLLFIAVISIFMLLLFFSFAQISQWYIKRNFLKGIDDLIITLDKIKDGDLALSADVTSAEEFEKISAAINHMLEGIKHKMDDTKTLMDQLEAAKIDAEAANYTKSSFLASTSHEIRTPMNGIIGFAELSLDEKLTPKTREHFLTIKQSAEGLLDIINDILDLSKIEADKLILESIPFSIPSILRICYEMYKQAAQEKGLDLFFYAEPSIQAMVLGDPNRFKQILSNILSNSVKFTNNGIVKLLTAVTEQTDTSLTIEFQIKDSGIGMTREQINRVFQPFHQADNSSTRQYGGTGLGLAITNALVNLMGGELSVESIPGIGSKFTFSLTFAKTDGDEPQAYLLPIETQSNLRPIFSGDVLVCEDNPINQQVAAEHLRRVGLTPLVCQNGEEGLEKCKSYQQAGKQFVVILMDMYMPVMDGLAAAKQIKELGIDTPIIAMTANAMADVRDICIRHGMIDYLPKPFTAQSLWRCLLNHLVPLRMEESENDSKPSLSTAYPE